MLRAMLVVLGMCLSLVAPRAVAAAVLAQSTFDLNDEGWRVGDLFSVESSVAPTYVATGGNPGGFLRTTDLFAWNAYHAPAKFLGNQSAVYGGTLHIEMRTPASDGATYPMIVLSTGVLSLQLQTMPPGAAWTSYDIPLLASAGWEVGDGSGNPGPPATEAQLQQVLANLSFLHIDADWLSGPDDLVDLDNVRLESSATAITVNLDIKPGSSFPHRINPRSRGKIPVAIVTTDVFDAAAVDATTVRFGPTGNEAAPVHFALEDVDGDGDIDLILHFKTRDTGIRCGDTSASLTGQTTDAQDIEGSAFIKTVGCK